MRRRQIIPVLLIAIVALGGCKLVSDTQKYLEQSKNYDLRTMLFMIFIACYFFRLSALLRADVQAFVRAGGAGENNLAPQQPQPRGAGR